MSYPQMNADGRRWKGNGRSDGEISGWLVAPSIAFNNMSSMQKRVDITGCNGIYFFAQDGT